MADRTWLLYGAYGFTGRLVAERAKERGLRPVLAGRNGAEVRALATRLDLPFRVFGLDSDAEVTAELAGIELVLHCAGPFSKTSRPMVDACLRAGAHYLDITGELRVIDAVLARHGEAKERGVVLMSAVGVDVVPTDCLARRLSEALPDATDLELALSGGLSPTAGTAKSAIEGLGSVGIARRNGKLVELPSQIVKDIPFGDHPRTCLSIPWGDLASAWFTTRIPNITTFMAFPRRAIAGAKAMKYLGPILTMGPVQSFLKRQADQRMKGPSDAERQTKRMYLWGRATNAAGRSVEATIDIPEGYGFTAVSSVAVVERVLGGEVPPGATTPGRALGADFVTELPGVGKLVVSPR